MLNLLEKLKQFKAEGIEESLHKRDSRVLIVDGTNTFIRVFSVVPALNEGGEHWGGFTGFLKSISSLIRQFRPSRIVIVFDGKGGSQRRRQLFKEYKDGRRVMERLNRVYDFSSKEEEAESQKKQLYRLIEALQLLPITIISQDNVEADDVIAYLTQQVKDRDGEVIICSTDKDFLQLVDDKVKVWSPVKKKLYDSQKVVEEFGIHPHNFIVFRTMDGDVSDNIPGVKGIGLVTLKKNFPELSNEELVPWEHIFAIAEEKNNAASKKILENKEILKRNMELMRLDEPQMSGASKIRVLEQFDGKISSINKTALIKLLSFDKLLGVVDVESLTTAFLPLARFSHDN